MVYRRPTSSFCLPTPSPNSFAVSAVDAVCMLDRHRAAKLLLVWSRDKLQASGFNVDWIALLAAEGGAASGTGVPAFPDDNFQLAAA